MLFRIAFFRRHLESSGIAVAVVQSDHVFAVNDHKLVEGVRHIARIILKHSHGRQIELQTEIKLVAGVALLTGMDIQHIAALRHTQAAQIEGYRNVAAGHGR